MEFVQYVIENYTPSWRTIVVFLMNWECVRYVASEKLALL